MVYLTDAGHAFLAASPAYTPRPVEREAVEAAARAMCDRVNGIGDYDENIEQRRSGWIAQAQAGVDAYFAALARPVEAGAGPTVGRETLREIMSSGEPRAWDSDDERRGWYAGYDAAVAEMGRPVEAGAGKLADDLRGLRGNFERIAARHPNEQPAYKDGVRPWGTGDLRHAIETLNMAIAALTTPAGGIAEGGR